MELKKVLYRTIHRKKESVDEIADVIGCSSSLLYRCANPNDRQARFPVEKVLPLMKAVNDFSILKHLAARSGFILYKLPSEIKPNDNGDLNRFQSLFADTFRALLDFKSGKITKEQCLSMMDELLTRTIEFRKSIEESDQTGFNFKGE